MLQPGVVVVGELFVAIGVLRVFSRLQGFVSSFNLKVIFTRELDGSFSILIVNDHEDLLITETAEFDSLLEEASFALAKGHVALVLVGNEFELVYLLLAHVYNVFVSIRCPSADGFSVPNWLSRYE